MRLLFIENRYATRIYTAAAVHLQRDGHEVHWLVQNPFFAPKSGTVHQLRFPRAADLETPGADPLFDRLQQSDRSVRYFGGQPLHYAHFRREVDIVFNAVKPDVVFGECTQLHELLAIDACRRRGVPYLFPTSTRYPPGRMCFMLEDSMNTVGGCGQDMPEDQARELIERVNHRSIAPSYMNVAPKRMLRSALRSARDKVLITSAWLLGERYLTPSPWRKVVVDIQHKRARQRWASLGERRPMDKEKPYLLYPLHMQPESSVDVWGLPWNNQAEIVRRAAASIEPLGWQLLVKPNPKPKYEIDDRLIAVVTSTGNIVPVPENVSMSALFPSAQGILSVCGTVLLEAVFAGKPALALGDHAMAQYPGVTALANPDEVALGLHRAAEKLRSTNATVAVQLVQSLYRNSYAVELFDPFNQLERINEKFGVSLATAFADVLAKLSLTKDDLVWAPPG